MPLPANGVNPDAGVDPPVAGSHGVMVGDWVVRGEKPSKITPWVAWLAARGTSIASLHLSISNMSLKQSLKYFALCRV